MGALVSRECLNRGTWSVAVCHPTVSAPSDPQALVTPTGHTAELDEGRGVDVIQARVAAAGIVATLR